MNTGFLKPKEDERDLRLGALPAEVLEPDGDWEAYLPVFERQKIGNTETYACTVFGSVSALEILLLKKYGI